MEARFSEILRKKSIKTRKNNIFRKISKNQQKQSKNIGNIAENLGENK
jgi:hypothetical protein